VVPRMNKKGRRRRVVSLLASVTLISALAAACSSSSGPSSGSGSLQSVTARMDWLPSSEQAPFYLALARGYYKDAGLNVTLVNGTGSSSTTQEIASGKDTFGYAAFSVVAGARTNVLEDVCTLMQNDPTSVVSLKSDPITSPTQLYGKKVGYPVGGLTVPNAAFFAGAHLNASKIQLVGLSFSDYYPALLSGKVQADIMWWSTDAPIVAAQKPIAPPILYAKYGANMLSESIIVRKSTVQQDPKLVREFVQATIRGTNAMMADPAAAVQAIKQYQPTFDTNTVLTQIKQMGQFLHTSNTVGKPYCWTSPADVRMSQTLLQKYSGLPKSADLQSMVTDQFVG
jgi:NitT/TauT family transport system substrate-binding protein